MGIYILLTLASVVFVILVAGLIWDEAWARFIGGLHRGVVIMVALTVPLLLTVGFVANVQSYGPPKTVEQRKIEERQAVVDRCVAHYTPDCGQVGPPGMDGRDRTRFDRCSACGLPGPDGRDGTEPFVKPRVDR
jgi:hypothetical protein